MSWTLAVVGDVVPGPAFLRAAKEAGVRVVLLRPEAAWSTLPAALDDSPAFYRSGFVPPEVEAAWARMDALRGRLQAAGLWDLVEVWTSPGTPQADFVASPQTDLVALAQAMGLRLGDGSSGLAEEAAPAG